MRLATFAGLLVFAGCARTSLEALEPLEDDGTAGNTTGGRATGGRTTGGEASGGIATGGAGASPTGGAGLGGVSTGGVTTGGISGTGASGGAEPPAYALVGAPLVVAPTPLGFTLNVAVASGAPEVLRAEVRKDGEDATWDYLGTASYPAPDVVEWSFAQLGPDTAYEYRIVARQANGENLVLYAGKATTQRSPGHEFDFALITDTHIPPRSYVPLDLSAENYQEATLSAIAPEVLAERPDFVMNLGDMLDYHMFGFNEPPPDPSWARLAYLNYRRLFGNTLGLMPHYPVIGNWEGENGCNSEEQIDRSRPQRMIYLPGPTPDTYPEGGSPNEDYYAFQWGDALFVVLNVMTYTHGCHYLSYDIGVPDDWTLGEEQLNWLRRTLEGASSRWRFVFIHHAVGGAAGDLANSAYGRGGGQAARVGEQSVIHDMMLQYGVQIFFYGHDHVFTDMTVDGIHYTLPGSAGAPWKFTTVETGYTNYWPDSGYGKVHVSPDLVRVEFIKMGGGNLMSYTIPYDG
jgi:3',5'-cyclic AMP phosphodiesterase CpdA